MKPFTISGQGTVPGTKKQIVLEPNVPGYEMPCTLLCGAEEGMTLVVTAGIHSGEYPGVAAAVRLAAELDPARIRGNLLIIHCVNTSGFWAKSPGRVPECGANLNANYPGRPDGTVGERIADYFVREIFPHADFLVDLHSGGGMEPLTPCLFFPAAAGEAVRETSLAAAMATDIPYLIASTAATGEYSYAACLGIPGLLLERGHSGACQPGWVNGYCKDLYGLLHHFGMLAPVWESAVCEKKIFEKTIYLTAGEKGLWYPQIEAGKPVVKGQLLGWVEDFFGVRIAEYRAEDDGTVFYHSCGLAVNPKDPLVAYGLEAFAHPAP